MKRVLIADDEQNIVISLEFLMKRAGYEVTVATDGEAALEAFAERAPDLVVLDVMLPKVNGFDVCRRLRAHPTWRDAKVLMLTARGRDAEIAKGMEVGADVYMTKPFSTRDLVAKVRELLGEEG